MPDLPIIMRSLDIPMRPRILRAYAEDFLALAEEIEAGEPVRRSATPAFDGTDMPPVRDRETSQEKEAPAAPPAGDHLHHGTPDVAVTTAPSDVETDAEGLPWDARIHASSKTKNKGDGAWRLKRGVESAYVEQVKAELRTAQAAPAAPAQLTPEPSAGSVFSEQKPAAGAATPPPPPEQGSAPAGTDSAPQNYAEFMTRVAVIPSERVNQVLQGLGVPNAALLSTRPDLIPAAWEQLKGEVA